MYLIQAHHCIYIHVLHIVYFDHRPSITDYPRSMILTYCVSDSLWSNHSDKFYSVIDIYFLFSFKSI